MSKKTCSACDDETAASESTKILFTVADVQMAKDLALEMIMDFLAAELRPKIA